MADNVFGGCYSLYYSIFLTIVPRVVERCLPRVRLIWEKKMRFEDIHDFVWFRLTKSSQQLHTLSWWPWCPPAPPGQRDGWSSSPHFTSLSPSLLSRWRRRWPAWCPAVSLMSSSSWSISTYHYLSGTDKGLVSPAHFKQEEWVSAFDLIPTTHPPTTLTFIFHLPVV